MVREKIPEIQILRAIAVSFVLLFHFTSSFSLGFLGVDMFFVISGYVIALSAIKDLDKHRFTLGNFLLKRLRRLWPPFALFFILTSILTILLVSPNEGLQQNSIKLQLAALFSLTNAIAPRLEGNYFGAVLRENPFLHTWSLSLEEQLFSVFGISIVILSTLGRRIPLDRRVSIIVFSSLLLLCFSVVAHFFYILFPVLSKVFPDAYMSPLTRLYQFGLGVSLGFWHYYKKGASKRPALFFILVLILIFFCSGLIKISYSQFLNGIIVSLLTLVLLDNRFAALKSEITRTLPFRYMIWKGNLSYEIYLWHWPVLIFSQLIFSVDKNRVLVIAVYVATLAFSKITNSLHLRWNRRFESRDWIKRWAIINLGLLTLSMSAAFGAKIGWGQDWALGKHEIVRADCDYGSTDIRCAWNLGKENAPAYILGDSMSWAIGDAALKVNSELGFSTMVRTRNACSIGFPSRNDFFDECDQWRDLVTKELLASRAKYVLVANSVYSDVEMRNSIDFIQALIDRHIPVILIGVPPGGDSFSARKSLILKGPKDRFSLKQDSSIPNVEVNSNLFLFFDTSKYLCQPKCIIAKDGIEFYNYGNHLSVSGALYLAPKLKEYVESVID